MPLRTVNWYLDFSSGYRGHDLLQTDCICIINISRSRPSLFLYFSHLFTCYWFCSRHVRLEFLSRLSAYKNYWESIFLRSRAVFRHHTLCRNKEHLNTELHGSGGLELVKAAREPASSHPKTCASLKNTPRILPVRRFLLIHVGRKQTVV